MVWLLMLHIAALLMWCAVLIHLPVLLAVAPKTRAAFLEPTATLPTIERFMFTHFATPFALLAIFAGTLVFLLNGTTQPWLIAKLTAVVGLVICHALLGLMIIRMEAIDWTKGDKEVSQRTGLPRSLRYGNYCLITAICSLILVILWLVLAKPTFGLSGPI